MAIPYGVTDRRNEGERRIIQVRNVGATIFGAESQEGGGLGEGRTLRC